jgi:opacity protein-like surface antigen
MKKSCLLAALSLPLAFLPASLHAQATAAASRTGGINVGITYTNSNQDEFTQRLQGISIYSTFDLSAHIGLEADAHLPSLISSFDNYTESSFDIGVRYYHPVRKFLPYGKLMVGFGSANAPNNSEIVGGGAPGSYFLLAAGGGLDYRLTDKITIRAIDYEYQDWTNFPPNGLTPSMISVGFAYRVR